MILSPFNPIFFTTRRSYGRECPYVQTFAKADNIKFQVLRSDTEEATDAVLVHAHTGEEIAIPVSTHSIGGGESVDVYTLPSVDEGCYFVAMGARESETFRITSDVLELEDTVLIEYSVATNRLRRDVVGVVDDQPFYFSFRVPGGFKDSGWEFAVHNEQFTTQEADIVEMYSLESTRQTLTLGNPEGVPVWFGDLLNRLLTCRYVYIDGLRYARSGPSVPEKEQPLESVNSFVFTQKLQRVNHLEPERRER